jgi:choline monooxygenase
MDPQLLRRELERFDPDLPLDSAGTPPASWYTSADFLALEYKAVFWNSWQPVGRAEQVRERGSFFSGDVCGQPVLIVRDEPGRLRAFYNVCRHHAAQVAPAAGRGSELVCPYHGWTYSLAGRLLRAPRLGAVRDFNPAEFSLKPIALAPWGPFVWLNFARQPRPLADDLHNLWELLAPTGFERLHFVTRRQYELQCNWKVFVDNYLDGGYHIAHVHGGLAGQLDLDRYRTEVSERFSVQSCSAAEEPRPQGGDSSERIGSSAIYAFVYPNFMINRYGPIMDTNWVVPLAVDRTRVVFDFYFDESALARDDFVAASLAASDQIQLEDMAICESVQRGLASAGYECGRYAHPLEVAAHHFHRLLWRDLACELVPPAS